MCPPVFLTFAQISNNSALVKCSANKDLHRAKVVGHVFTDGHGHSLSSYLRQLYIAEMYGCRSTLPTRYAVLRNYVFVPWDTIPVPEMTAGNKSNASQPNFQPAMYWLDHDPTQFLYCHQKHATAAYVPEPVLQHSVCCLVFPTWMVTACCCSSN